MNAHPPNTSWRVETYDPVAREWFWGTSFSRRQMAVDSLNHRATRYPAWRDGTPVQRRLVLETTTFEDVLAEPAHRLAKFPKAGFLLPCVGGQDLAVLPGTTPDGRPALRFSVGSSDTGHAEALIPLELLEEVVAGQRDTARQAGGQPEPEPVTVRIEVGDDDAVKAMIRRIVADGPTGSVE